MHQTRSKRNVRGEAWKGLSGLLPHHITLKEGIEERLEIVEATLFLFWNKLS